MRNQVWSDAIRGFLGTCCMHGGKSKTLALTTTSCNCAFARHGKTRNDLGIPFVRPDAVEARSN